LLLTFSVSAELSRINQSRYTGYTRRQRAPPACFKIREELAASYQRTISVAQALYQGTASQAAEKLNSNLVL
jgi:hypothetical protein